MKPSPARQLPLALRIRSHSRLDDFIVNPDATLLETLALQRGGSEPLLYLHGAPGSGRTHLLLGQCNAAQASGLQVAFLPASEQTGLDPSILDGLEQLDLVAIDDVHLLAGKHDWELALFNLFNRIREQGSRLLLSADSPATASGFAMPDLQTRLAWGISLGIPALDDTRRELLLQGLAKRRGLEMPHKVARYLIQRHARDNQSLQQLVERLDHDSMAEQRHLSIPFVRQRLDLEPE